MKKSTFMLAILLTSTLIVGIAYASFRNEFTVKSTIDTYNMDIRLNTIKVDHLEEQVLKFNLNDDLYIEVKNLGSVPVYIKSIGVEYSGSNHEIIKDLNYNGLIKLRNIKERFDAGISFMMSDLMSSSNSLNFKFNSNKHLIEPISHERGSYRIEFVNEVIDEISITLSDSKSNKEDQIKLLQKEIKQLKKNIAFYNDEIERIEAYIETTEEKEDKEYLKGQLANYKSMLEAEKVELSKKKSKVSSFEVKLESIISEIDTFEEVLKNDEIYLYIQFSLFNR